MNTNVSPEFAWPPRSWVPDQVRNDDGGLAGCFQSKAERSGVVGEGRWCVTAGRFFAALKNDIGELRIEDVR